MSDAPMAQDKSAFWANVRFALWPDVGRFLSSQDGTKRARQQMVAYWAYAAVWLVPGAILGLVGLLAASGLAAFAIELLAAPLFLLPGIYALILTTRIALALRRL